MTMKTTCKVLAGLFLSTSLYAMNVAEMPVNPLPEMTRNDDSPDFTENVERIKSAILKNAQIEHKRLVRMCADAGLDFIDGPLPKGSIDRAIKQLQDSNHSMTLALANSGINPLL